jgi:hypothetical protein
VIRTMKWIFLLITLAEDIEVHIPDIAPRQKLEWAVIDARENDNRGSRLFDLDGDYPLLTVRMFST